VNLRIGFVGAGRWAMALGLGFDRLGHSVALWEPDAALRERLAETRRHPDLPETAVLPESVKVSAEPGPVLERADLVVFACPSSALAAAAAAAARASAPADRIIITVTKGIDPESLRRLSLILKDAFPGLPVVVLAGPGIPYDYAAGDPTSLVAASDDPAAAHAVRDGLTGNNLRIYSSPDVCGVELGAALKNVIALAAGICDGLGLGINTRAALLTRGLAEMTRLGIALDANPLTFAGLSGMGDLIVTAFSEHSRNHSLGRLLGEGLSLAEAAARLHGVAEGATTARAARRLADRHRVEMPVVEEVCRILYENTPPKKSLRRLLNRPTKEEAA